MIFATQIRRGIAAGVVRFIPDPNLGSGTVCAIGDHWFYFGGEQAKRESPEEYLEHVSIENVVRNIILVLDDFWRFKCNEYNYYEAVLKKAEEVPKKNNFAFDLGRLVATRGVADLISEDRGFSAFVDQSLARYVQCDFGDICAEDQQSNNDAIKQGERILAEYREPNHPDWHIWIITEWDRSVTTVLFPDEY